MWYFLALAYIYICGNFLALVHVYICGNFLALAYVYIIRHSLALTHVYLHTMLQILALVAHIHHEFDKCLNYHAHYIIIIN